MIGPESSNQSLVDVTVLQGLRSYARSAQFLPQLIEIFEEHGRQSLSELQAACLGEDWSNVRRIAHRFKGSCLNLGAKSLAEELAQIEAEDLSASSTPGQPELDPQHLQGLFEETCKVLRLFHEVR